MTIFDFISSHRLAPIPPEEAKNETPYGMLLGLGASTVYTNHDSIWVVVEDEGPLFRLRYDTVSYGGNKNDQHAALASLERVEQPPL